VNSTRLRTFSLGSDVRHLLIQGEDNASWTLSTLINGVRTEVEHGPLYKMEESADTLTKQWCDEGLRWRGDNSPPVWEPLRHVVTLVKLLGHNTVMEAGHLATIPLDRWTGCRDKNGDDYIYGYDGGMNLYAQPNVSARHGLNMEPKTNEEFIALTKKAIEIRKALGPDRHFFLN
jgi:hypothetical protein